MNTKQLSLCASLAVLSTSMPSTSVFAGVPKFIDARAFAMGGVGVVSARPAAASFFNPALLAIEQKENRNGFGMLIPSINVLASDEDELIDTADDFEKDFLDPFEAAVDNFDIVDLNASNAELARQAIRMDDELERINNDQALIEAGAGFSFEIPSTTQGAGLFVSTTARVAAALSYRDQALMQEIIDTASDPFSQYTDPNDIPYDLSEDDLQSSVRGVAAATAQAGVSLARSFELAGRNIAFGISPKVVELRAYDYSYNADNFDDFDSDTLKDTKVSKKSFNLDLGVASFMDRDKRWLAGMSIINLIPMDVTTKGSTIEGTTFNPQEVKVEGRKVELKPVITAGLSYSGASYVLAADLELTKTDALLYEDDTQYLGVGGEYDVYDVFQLRLGARHNLAGSGATLVTAGFGLSVFGATLELAGMADTGSDTVGASLQFGATF